MDRYKNKKRNRFLITTALFAVASVAGFLYYKSFDAHMTAEAQKPPEPVKTVVKSDITISAAGDCTIGYDTSFGYANSFPYILDKNNKDYSYFFKNTSDIFKNDDISTVNLETTFTNATIKAEKAYAFKAPPEQAAILKAGGIDAANIANNHIYDYFKQGYEDTKAALAAQNIDFFGDGPALIKEVKGMKFGFLGYTVFTNSKSFENRLKEDITYLKGQGCIVIINFHWGIERVYTPNETQRKLAHYAIDNGADLIIGHHPHVVQSIEQYKNKMICYSLGNFCFGGNKNPSDKDAFIAQAVFKTEDYKLKAIGFRVIPASISSVDYVNDYCPTPMTGVKKDGFLVKLNDMSPDAGFAISDQYHYIDQ